MYVVIKYIILKLLDVLTLFLLGFWTDLNYWGGAVLGPNNVKLYKVIKTPQDYPKMISNEYGL